VKPGNILLMEKRSDGENHRFRHCPLDSSDDLQKTNAGRFSARRAICRRNRRPVSPFDGRSDCFPWCDLYELLTERRRSTATNVATLVFQIMHKDPTPIRTLSPDVPIGLQRIVAKCSQNERTTGSRPELSWRRRSVENCASIAAQEEEASRNKFVSLRVKWAALWKRDRDRFPR